MHSSFDDVEFLAGSVNRFGVLDAVSTSPRTRDELKGRTGLSRVALSRALSDLEDRGWIIRAGHHYEATPLGAVVTEEFESLLDNLNAATELKDVLGWLPTDEFGFDLHHLEDATITRPTTDDHTASVRYAVKLIREADRFRAVATGVGYEIIEALHERTVENDRPVKVVIDEAAIEFLRSDEELGPLFREILAAEGTDVYRYGGGISLVMMTITDEFVSFRGYDEPAIIEHVTTTNQAVQAWAESYFESVRETAERLTADEFTRMGSVD